MVSRIRSLSLVSVVTLGLGIGAAAVSPGVLRKTQEPILEIGADTLTAFQYASSTNIQGVRPLVDQRGTTLEGALRSASTLPVQLGANPLVKSQGGSVLNGVRLATGTFAPTDVDIALPTDGPALLFGRSYNGRQKTSGGSHQDSDGYQGKNWAQTAQPELSFYDDADDAKDVLYLQYGADRFVEFLRDSSGSSEFNSMNGSGGAFQVTTGAGSDPDTYKFFDQRGNTMVFFGFDGDAAPAEGQLWKITDAAGNVTFIGDEDDAADAITNGYDADGRMTTAYDASDRRFTSTYTTLDGTKRLTKTEAEIKTGGTWASPTGLATVAKVEYSYYGDESYGDIGDLKMIEVTTPMTDSGVEQVRKKLIRYWEGTFNASTNPGHPHAIKLVLDYEGTRRFDYQDSTFDEDFLTASHASLEPYASVYFEYDSNHRITEAFFNGECGCSGAANGTYEFEYESNGSYTDNAGYDTTWKERTIVKRPDGSYMTTVFDEVGQPVQQVITDADPDNTSPTPNRWVTKITRDSDGLVTEISTPANVTGYTHSTGAITTSATVGLVRTLTRVSSGDLKGLVTDRKHKTGTSGSAYFDETLTHTSETRTVGDVVLRMPLVASRRVYSQEITSGTTGSYLTSYAYTFHSGKSLAMEKITTTNPAVATANNGSGSATTQSMHLNTRGLVDFEKSPSASISYSEYDAAGRRTKRIEDADTTKTASGEDFEGVTIPTGFSSSGTPIHWVTTSAHDAQGRVESTTKPGGRVMKTYRSKLKDERLVTLAYADYETTPSTKFFGPVRYTVSNLAGKAEVQATVALTSNETTSALTAHIDETDDDPITAADLGTLAKMTVSLFNESGSTLQETRLYHLVPASGDGTDGTNYDPTLFGYDDLGRRTRQKQPHGTITRTVYDIHGRSTESWIGTNDSSFDGGEASGTDNMVKTKAQVFDSGSDDGNGYLTKRTLFVEDSSTDERVTDFENDVRGRVLLEKRPTAPHVFNKLDNMGRSVASGSFSSHSSIVVGTDDPTTETTNRMALSQTFHDELGRVWKSQRHKIDAADGSDDDNLQTLNWYDDDGQRIKQDGNQLTKRTYDRLGRQTHSFILARDNDTAYSDADDVTGDIVVEERQTTYDASDGSAIMRAVIERFHDDWGATPTTGALDTNADSDDLKYTAANLDGRIQITASWFDRFDRVTDTVRYGTYGDSDFDRDGLTVPTRSDTALRTTTTYSTSGDREEVEDARGIVARTEYSATGRRTKVIRNYDSAVNSGNPSGTDDNVTVVYTYTDGLRTKLTADLPSGSTDQDTTYTFGTTKGVGAGDSNIETGHLLQEVEYPDSTSGTDVVTFAYNAQGQQLYKKDQAGNVFESDFDDAGRRTHMRITTLASGFDGAVRRISTTYDSLGRRDLVTQYDNATVGSGTVTDEVDYTYEGWGKISKFEQDRNSAVGASGSVDDYEVSYTYTKNTSGRNSVRIVTITHPSGQVITLRYRGDTDDRHDTYLNRVTHADPPTALVIYAYNGLDSLVGTDYLQTNVVSNNFGTTSGSYPDLDRFNRLTTNRWTKDLATDVDFYQIDLSYDRGSNITLIEDNVHAGFDVEYTIDDINRVTQAEEGTWSGSAITSRTRDQQWTHDHVGNWDGDKVDLNGDGDFIDTDEVNDDRTHNDVNELTGRDTDDNGTDDFTLTYDAVGGLTDDGETYKQVYDALGRLRKVLDRSDDSLVAEYKYNGLGHRISVHEDTDDDGDVDASDKWFHHAYSPRWQLLATFREDDTDPKEEFVFNLAGLDGGGGASYIDDVLFRDKDANTAWTAAADAVMEQRIYYCQNWRADVSALVEQTGEDAVELKEWVKYSAYGVPFGLPGGDTDSDGDCDATDESQVTTWKNAPAYDVRGDIDLNGDVDADDETLVTNSQGEELARGTLSSQSVYNRSGFAGRPLDAVGFLMRRRCLLSGLGRWGTRDPAGYSAGQINLFAFSAGNPVSLVDPMGTQSFLPGQPTPGPQEPPGTPIIPIPDFSFCEANEPVITTTSDWCGQGESLRPSMLRVLQAPNFGCEGSCWLNKCLCEGNLDISIAIDVGGEPHRPGDVLSGDENDTSTELGGYYSYWHGDNNEGPTWGGPGAGGATGSSVIQPEVDVNIKCGETTSLTFTATAAGGCQLTATVTLGCAKCSFRPILFFLF